MTDSKKLYRSSRNRVLAGVCGGLGEYFEIDPVLIRIGFILLTLAHGLGILLYIILMIIIPKESGKEVKEEAKVDLEASAKEIKEIAQNLGEQAKAAATELKEQKSWFSEKRNIVGLVLIIIGFIALTNILFPMQMYWFRWNYLWPTVIIIIGVYLIIK